MRILIVTSKWAILEHEIDGGCMTACNILESISNQSIVDILLPEKYKTIKIDGISKYFYYLSDNDTVKNFNGHNKFVCRINISKLVAPILRKIHIAYDKIVIIHAFHAFEICKTFEQDILNKIILFPMFLTPSYHISGEYIPCIYTALEENTLKTVHKIITPSIFELNQIKTIYNVDSCRIVCIPRFVSSLFNASFRTIKPNNPIKICYIASVKKQKQILKALELLKLLLNQKLNTHLYLVGAIHDLNEYMNILTYVNDNCLKENVSILNRVSQVGMNKLFSQVFINISVSKCETFGRSIIEGLYTGLPAFVLKSAECFETLIGYYNGVEYFNEIEEMAVAIKFAYENKKYYQDLCTRALNFGNKFSEGKIKPLLQKEILCQI